MPHKNTVRHYVIDSYYHIYNRGVEKREIFLEKQDYEHFLELIEDYLTPKPSPPGKLVRDTTYWRSRLDGGITLLCFCLMPNHFHLLIKQTKENSITKLMRRLSNAYVRYFNKKYNRVGGLFQGKFKAAHIDNENYLFHLSRYIHRNPEVGPLDRYPYSSYQYYLGKPKPPWLNPTEIISHFSSSVPSLFYKSFVEESSQGQVEISNLILEEI